jgi:hypothetical protein
MSLSKERNAPLVGAVSVGSTQTPINSLRVGAGTLSAGNVYRIDLVGAKDSTSAAVTFNVYLGPTATTSDTQLTTVAVTPTASTGVYVTGVVTVLTAANGAGTAIGQLHAVSSGASGVSTTTSPGAVNTALINYLTVSAASASGAFTVQHAVVTQGA